MILIRLRAGEAFIEKRKGSESPAKALTYLFCTDYTNQYNPNQVFPVGDGFGFIFFFDKFEKMHFRNGVIKRPAWMMAPILAADLILPYSELP